MTRHPSTYEPFCPRVSEHPNIDYSRVAHEAAQSYPGAKDQTTALKHTQMQVENAITHYSAEAHQRDKVAYTDG